MFAINHAATALLIHRKYPEVPFLPILISVQAMEIVWVVLNYVGIERATTEAAVRYVGDIHLDFMPYSHSIATMVGAAILAWVVGVSFGRPRLGAAVGIGIASHLFLDLATHNGDIALAPFVGGERYGTYLYGQFPAGAFVLEIGFAVACWWAYGGGRSLLAIVVGFNLANVSLFFPSVPGLEAVFAGRPTLLITVILFQIIVTLSAIWWGEKNRAVPSVGSEWALTLAEAAARRVKRSRNETPQTKPRNNGSEFAQSRRER